MLSTIPVELQSHILSHLPRKDLAAVARVSQHLHAVAIKILYLKVELKSWNHLESFFFPGSLIPSGSISATQHAEARRSHWEMIKDLSIHIRYSDKRTTSFLIPRSLRGRNVRPLQIERLRLIYEPYAGNLGLLVPLLECLNPKEVSLFSGPPWYAGNAITALSKVGGWTRLDGLALVLEVDDPPRNLAEVCGTSVFAGIVAGTVDLEIGPWANTENGADAVAYMIALLPSLQHLRIFVEKEKQSTVEALLKDGFGGKGSEFFTVEVGDPDTFERE